jgi:hypothetical protein
MLVAVAFVPSAPLLLPALGGGPEDLTAACLRAVAALDGLERLVVVGAAAEPGPVTGTVDATPWGALGRPAPDALPLALAVGSSLASSALGRRSQELHGVLRGTRLDLDGDSRRTGLLVVGDGTSMRTEKAPGHYDPRAEGFDQQVEAALAAADPEALLALDEGAADQLWVGGLAAWRAAAVAARAEVRPDGAAPAGWRGQLHYAAAPYGVCYLVATWLPAA